MGATGAATTAGGRRRNPAPRCRRPIEDVDCRGPAAPRPVVGIGVGQPRRRHLEVDAGIGGVAHLHLGPAQHLHGPRRRAATPSSSVSWATVSRSAPGRRHQVGATLAKALTQDLAEVGRRCWGPHPGRGEVGHGRERPGGVPSRPGPGAPRRARAGRSSASSEAASWSKHGEGVAGQPATHRRTATLRAVVGGRRPAATRT